MSNALPVTVLLTSLVSNTFPPSSVMVDWVVNVSVISSVDLFFMALTICDKISLSTEHTFSVPPIPPNFCVITKLHISLSKPFILTKTSKSAPPKICPILFKFGFVSVKSS